jgi:hypothetical protein
MEEDLLSDLIEYRKSKDKGVVTASRGLLQLFREVNPGLLKKRERVSTIESSLTRADFRREKQQRWVLLLRSKYLRMVTPKKYRRESKD